jgi:hypothetical protein
MKWTRCCFCQTILTSLELRHPYKENRHHHAYDSIEDDVNNFIFNSLPLPCNVKPADLNDGSGIANTLLRNQARYHKHCRQKIYFRNVDQQAKQERKRELEPREKENEIPSVSPKKTRTYLDLTNESKHVCAICQVQGDETLHEARSAQRDLTRNFASWAAASRKWDIHARLLNSPSAFYHRACYLKLKDEFLASSTGAKKNHKEDDPYDPLVMAELVLHIKNSDVPLKLSNLTKLYKERLQATGSRWASSLLHATRFKEYLLMKLGTEWRATKEGKEIILSSSSHVSTAWINSGASVTGDEADQIIAVAMKLREYTLVQQPPFNGTFNSDSVLDSVPAPLLTLINVLIEGADSIASDNKDTAKLKVAAVISQLICCNTTKKSRKGAKTSYQMRSRETPFPLYMGLKLHVTGRQKSVIMSMHKFGVSVSYDRVFEVRTHLAGGVASLWEETGVVFPTNMRKGILVTCAIDNIDISGKYEYHGTAMSMTCHPTYANPGHPSVPVKLEEGNGLPIKLPEEYITIPFVEETNRIIRLRPNGYQDALSSIQVQMPNDGEGKWLTHVQHVLRACGGELQDVPITYSGFFSDLQDGSEIRPDSIIGTFPTLHCNVATMTMQKHALRKLSEAVEHLNSDQTPIVVGDCPVYAQMKKCQWTYPEEFGESKIVCFMGLLHVEMAAQECTGKLLAGSGWERMFQSANIFTPGVASSLLGGKHVKRTRYAHQLTLAWIHILKTKAYEDFCNTSQRPNPSFQMWQVMRRKDSETFNYWCTVEELLLTNMRLLRGQRSGDWLLTLDSCRELCPWLMAFGHVNYGRWMPVWLKDMADLSHQHPAIYDAFMGGMFCVQRSQHKFSLMAMDQSHEHTIKHLKEDGGTWGLFGQEEQKTVIELSRPEVLRIAEEFENASQNVNKTAVHHTTPEHPESTAASQRKFLMHLQVLLGLVERNLIINPFADHEKNLITLDTGEIMQPEIASSLRSLHSLGQEIFEEFWHERIETATTPLSNVIRKPTVYTFLNRPTAKASSNAGQKSIASLEKGNTALVTKMFLSLRSRPEADMDDFFRHENRKEPPSLSQNSCLRAGTKSDIVRCLPALPEPGRSQSVKTATVIILDMAAIVHIVRPTRASTFEEYMKLDVYPYMKSLTSESTLRIDAVWDRYEESSVKWQARQKRGNAFGSRTRVQGSIPIPKGKSWDRFLEVGMNKEALFNFLAQKLIEESQGSNIVIITTQGKGVITNKPLNNDLTALGPCGQDEADTRMMLHAQHAQQQGHTKGYIVTVDSDVVVLAIHFFHQLNMSELWIGFGRGKTFRHIPIHEIVQQMTPIQCRGILFFHAFTGSDITSSFLGKGKRTGWNIWECMGDNLSAIFATFASSEAQQFAITSDEMKILESFTVKLYCKTSSVESVNQARQEMFTQGVKSLEALPPTRDALYQHARRSIFATMQWASSLQKERQLPPANDWGWRWNDSLSIWYPYWTDLPDASAGCSLLFKCSCRVACKGKCKCKKADIKCSELCNCKGACS